MQSLINPIPLEQRPEYNQFWLDRGDVVVKLAKTSASAKAGYNMHGRLIHSNSGWLLLEVPNALARGVFLSLSEPGAQLPLKDGVFNAHISVMTPGEVESIGGADRINERGDVFNYNIGSLKSVTPRSWSGISKTWFVEVQSPNLKKLRKSYGLTPTPQRGDKSIPFHITVAIRKVGVLGNNEIAKDSPTSSGNGGVTLPEIPVVQSASETQKVSHLGAGAITGHRTQSVQGDPEQVAQHAQTQHVRNGKKEPEQPVMDLLAGMAAMKKAGDVLDQASAGFRPAGPADQYLGQTCTKCKHFSEVDSTCAVVAGTVGQAALGVPATSNLFEPKTTEDQELIGTDLSQPIQPIGAPPIGTMPEVPEAPEVPAALEL